MRRGRCGDGRPARRVCREPAKGGAVLRGVAAGVRGGDYGRGPGGAGAVDEGWEGGLR